MHFITGGAFNGKKKWVKGFYKNVESIRWISAYEEVPFPEDLWELKEQVIVLEGIEQWLKQLIEKDEDSESCRKFWCEQMAEVLGWEKAAPGRTVVFIGTDITKGIVPIDAKDRQWRDLVGWVFQDVVERALRVDVVWYGIATKLK